MKTATVDPLFQPIERTCSCCSYRVDQTDIIVNGWLHGLGFCFELKRK